MFKVNNKDTFNVNSEHILHLGLVFLLLTLNMQLPTGYTLIGFLRLYLSAKVLINFLVYNPPWFFQMSIPQQKGGGL